MFLPEHTKYHKLGPKDIAFKGTKVSTFAVTRQSSGLGEQVSIECPIYDEDTRENMMNRINMCYSILQERLEDENTAALKIEALAKSQHRERQLKKEAKERNARKFEADKKEIKRKSHKEKWTGEKVSAALTDLAQRFDEAQLKLDESKVEDAPVVDIGVTKEG